MKKYCPHVWCNLICYAVILYNKKGRVYNMFGFKLKTLFGMSLYEFYLHLRCNAVHRRLDRLAVKKEKEYARLRNVLDKHQLYELKTKGRSVCEIHINEPIITRRTIFGQKLVFNRKKRTWTTEEFVSTDSTKRE
jgi:hypothetical protein